MKHALFLSLAIALVPVSALAQAAPPPPDAAGAAAPTAQQMAAMRQMHALMEQSRVQTKSQILAALTPAHRTAVANIFGQLALTPNPNYRAAAQALDNVLAPAEKQSVLSIDATAHANMRTLMAQHRAQFESTLTADERAAMAQREAKRQAFMQTHPRPAPDAGMIVLRTLGGMEGPGMHGRPM